MKILLTGASGWFGQSFIAEYVKSFGPQKLSNLILTTSDGRDISHPLLDFKLPTLTNAKAQEEEEVDLIVQSCFLTREKIDTLGIKKYNALTEQIIEEFDKILKNNKNAVVCVISSGAVHEDSSRYGFYKRVEEGIAKNSYNKRVIIFRIFGATTKYMDFRSWSAVCSFIKDNLNERDIFIKDNYDVLRGYVCMEDLSQIILNYFEVMQPNQSKTEVYDAVADIISIREIALGFVSEKTKVILPNRYDRNRKDYSYIGEKEKFINLTKRLNVTLKNCPDQFKNAQLNYYTESYLD
jgi:nucleoside-diphosphate-sugar epimerase